MSRLKFTTQFLEHMPAEQRLSVDQALVAWWYDPRVSGGLRLSWVGFTALINDLDLEHWTFNFERQGIPPWIYLKLDHHLTAPYYMVDNKKMTCLTVFSSRDSMMINLYGNVEKWIASLA